jgi:hypothetical protein
MTDTPDGLGPHQEPHHEPPPMPLDPAQIDAVKRLMGHGIDAETAVAAVVERLHAQLLLHVSEPAPDTVPEGWDWTGVSVMPTGPSRPTRAEGRSSG